MEIKATKIHDVKLIMPTVFSDSRGFFLETFNAKRYQEMLDINLEFVQDNYSRSAKNVLRGLHFQTKNAQGKLVRVAKGSVFDVAVDVRKDSPTYGMWDGVILSEDNQFQLWIPPGLAHGFLVLSDIADFEYKCTDYYAPQNEACLIWNDPDIGIDWPIFGIQPMLSEKDNQGKAFSEL